MRAAIRGQVYKNPSNDMRNSLANSARCFRETAPEAVLIHVKEACRPTMKLQHSPQVR